MMIMILLLSIVAIIGGCRGADEQFLWTPKLNQKILEIYYRASPSKKGHEQRMKNLWDEELPKYKDQSSYKLRRHACSLIKKTINDWERKMGFDLKETDERLSRIDSFTESGEADREKKMSEELRRTYPEFKDVPLEILRNVVHKLNKQKSLKRKEPEKQNVPWSPQYKADLLYIFDRVRIGKGDITQRIYKRWIKMNSDLDTNANTLCKHAYKLEKTGYKPRKEEMEEAKRKYDRMIASNHGEFDDIDRHQEYPSKRKHSWSRQEKADLLYMYDLNKSDKGNIGYFLERHWNNMYPDSHFMNGHHLRNLSTRLKRSKYEPTTAENEKARIRYEKFLASEESHPENERATNSEGIGRTNLSQKNHHVVLDSQGHSNIPSNITSHFEYLFHNLEDHLFHDTIGNNKPS